ncbi:alanine racemase [Solirubrobacter sp. CPCC 204708]|uniref:Alanine racemase n=1 Tax=Solirubrobacter deserti TaxID=2282478 RepID=A0ABT4RIG7_9ACTN|nr:alanine racemase [Solirubrobacter deserti]MBE2320263.1 alanine racemase [Solirubrobacter deserti]MDA0138352.1 alanine racemase [Solirubrobacter deserti]
MRALARISTGAIERNCARLATLGPLCAVVKANGYGHGAVEAARAAQRGGAAWLAVATANEAAELRAAGISGPLLVMGALAPDELRTALRAEADVIAWREAFVAGLPPSARVHVKLDTGMGRLGTRDPAEAERVAAAAGDRLVGVMTHFATADDDPAFMREQLERFVPWADQFGVMRHAANSAGALGEPEARLDLLRCGIAIYGMDPFHRDPADHGLEPALSLVSYVAAVKRARAGDSVGYGRRFIAERDTWVGTIPIGYGDGYRRGLTGRAEVLVGGRRVPLAGTVSMDNITVDLGEDPVDLGTEAVLIGQGLLAEELASKLGTINYEITCGLTARVPRTYE